ncbi:MAG: hypothetical protein HOC34_01720 [Candidatus Magasanikbacteria bacterium]|nr:hypothetical protein [Candidatus Magasanikbacteria bacterium]MBT4220913.1 hypothetical protein [Candidatus Magasanikbacteria bacterium]MBT4350204.1 hypothetical protein [Candidatus Magasanikbacteria bacterium]MBT4541662.1 hypothetical protein [Candidatus Magasanikbacteria bacterium]MBT6252829.1 hypothetical protein [Candidatus Magasanikbacteria bacterium]
MITIPFYIFLLLYLLFVGAFAIFLFINLFHIFDSASLTLASFIFTFFIFALTILVLFFTWELVSAISLTEPVTIFDSTWISRVFTIGSS